MSTELTQALIRLKEDDLTRRFIIPLIERLHPGTIEFTHSPLEAGRDIVSFGYDSLGREHVLCVQVKAVRVPTGARFGEFSSTLQLAKQQGVTLENGNRCYAHEVWLITSHPFNETQRRQVSDVLQNLDRSGIKVVAGDELRGLLIANLPAEVSTLINASGASVGQMLSDLVVHTEGRAFGFSSDRRFDQFYVTATLSLECKLAYRAMSGSIVFTLATTEIPPDSALTLKLAKSRASDAKNFSLADLKESALRNYRHREFLDHNDIPYWFGQPSPIRKMIAKAKKREAVVVPLNVDLAARFNELVERAIVAVSDCPRELNRTAADIARVWRILRLLNDNIEHIYLAGLGSGILPRSVKTLEPLRVRVTRSADLVDLEHTVLVDGPPGCGKTTLLKTLAVDLLSQGEKALYLACFKVPRAASSKKLFDMAKEFGVGSQTIEWPASETILLLDGLDEAEFDMTPHIDRDRSDFKGVVVSCRTAYAASMRKKFATLSLAPFTLPERDLFFQKWFANRPDCLRTVTELFYTYRDIAEHSTLPLIATILAALVESGFSPRSRAEIYNQRLDLLLSRWDKSRGVNRTKVENPEAKRRFLRYLAYYMHASSFHTRTIRRAAIPELFEKAVGDWGYRVDLSDVIHDLVLVHGVLIEESPGSLSFGHLTFQEHLAGEAIARERDPQLVVDLLGDEWWTEPLNFYASIVGDISEVIDVALEDAATFQAHAAQLLTMATYAPFTSPGALDSLRETADERREEKESDNSDVDVTADVDEGGDLDDAEDRG